MNICEVGKSCPHHNLHCAYPNCPKGKAENKPAEKPADLSQEDSISLVKRLPKMSHIDGNLYIGSWPDGEVDDEIQFIIRCNPHRRPYIVKPHQTQVKAYLFDSNELPDINVLHMLSHVAVSFLSKGKTLIHCKGGLNRSGLVSAMALMDMGYKSREAIDLIRARRSEHMLNNGVFEEFLLNLDPYEVLS